MRTPFYYFLLLMCASGLSLCAASQVPDIDSLEKTILESVQKTLDKNVYSNSYLDSLKLNAGKSPINVDQLLKDINKDLKAAKSKGDIDRLGTGYRELSSLESMRGNYKGAYENYKLYTLYRDSLQKKEMENKAMQAKMQYEFDKKQAVAKAEQQKKRCGGKKGEDDSVFYNSRLNCFTPGHPFNCIDTMEK